MEQITKAVDELLESQGIERLRGMVESMDVAAPAELNEGASSYFEGSIGGKATKEIGDEIGKTVFELYSLPEIDTDTKCVFAGAYAAHNLLSDDNGPLTVGEVLISFWAYHLANIQYRVRILRTLGIEDLKKVEGVRE